MDEEEISAPGFTHLLDGAAVGADHAVPVARLLSGADGGLSFPVFDDRHLKTAHAERLRQLVREVAHVFDLAGKTLGGFRITARNGLSSLGELHFDETGIRFHADDVAGLCPRCVRAVEIGMMRVGSIRHDDKAPRVPESAPPRDGLVFLSR
jgi:hypothetical protein